MIDWVQKGDDWETTIGYTRVQIWRSSGKRTWEISLYDHTHEMMNRNESLRTRRIDIAKERACKFLIEILTDQRDTIDAWLKQLKD